MNEDAKTEAQEAAATVNELVGRFSEKESFSRAVKRLREAGIPRHDLSVLDTHESLAASKDETSAWQEQLTSLVGEITYIGPITAAGLIALASGPVGALIAGGIAAGVTGLALWEILEKTLSSNHHQNFQRALEHGALLLWVRVKDQRSEARVRAILEEEGAADLHLVTRRA